MFGESKDSIAKDAFVDPFLFSIFGFHGFIEIKVFNLAFILIFQRVIYQNSVVVQVWRVVI